MYSLRKKSFNILTLCFIVSSFYLYRKVDFRKSMENKSLMLSYSAHIFYYNWYGNPEFDQFYRHWNHNILPHWSDSTWNNTQGYDGYNTIGSNFYPKLGTYSSNNPDIIRKHMEMISKAGIGTISVSWWGQNSYEDNSIKIILDMADLYCIKVNFHIEPFPNRNALSTIEAITYIIDQYGKHNAFYTYKDKPLFYVYDSYLISKEDWASVLTIHQKNTIRNTKYNSIFIGLWVNEQDSIFFKESGFDGFYTYFASDGFTYGSTINNWEYLSNWANVNNKIFIPCVGPGYNDERIRPWNTHNYKDRENGKYFDEAFKTALAAKPRIVGITSFNEWHEGTQIEPAIPKVSKNFIFEDYEEKDSNYYLNRTYFWLNRFKNL